MDSHLQRMRITHAWGRAKRLTLASIERRHPEFNQRQIQQTWQRIRLHLKRKNLQYPPTDLVQGEPDIFWEGFAKKTPYTAGGETQKDLDDSLNIVERQLGPDPSTEVPDDHIPVTAGEQSQPSNTQQQTPPEATEASMTEDMMHSGSSPQKRMRPADEETIRRMMAGQGSDGGIASGPSETMGGSGGGLAGAGNNTLFNGFGGYTKPKGHVRKTMTETYKQTFAVHSTFPASTDSWEARLKMDRTKDKWDYFNDHPKQVAETYHGECNHNGIFIPYTLMEASMQTCDWNKPNEFIGYKVKEIGFNIPNMRLAIMNNDRKNTEQVAPAPPSDARMWVFVDTFNDYGIPQPYNHDKIQHNQWFTETDIVQADIPRYSLPLLGARHFEFDEAEAKIIALDRRFQLTTDHKYLISQNPDAIYDMKRHPNYHEFVLSDAQLGITYTPNAPIVQFPAPRYNHHTMEAMTTEKGAVWSAAHQIITAGSVENQVALHQWTTHYEDAMFKEGDDTKGTTDNSYRYWLSCNKHRMDFKPGYYQQPNDSNAADVNTMTINTGKGQMLPNIQNAVANADLKERGSYNLARYTPSGFNSNDDTVHIQGMTKRPPLFIIGVHKELEDRSTDVQFWRYYMFGQVEYSATIEWIIDLNRHKPYLPIGMGGVYNTTTIGAVDNGLYDHWLKPAATDKIQRDGRASQILDRAPFRYKASIEGATTYEATQGSDLVVNPGANPDHVIIAEQFTAKRGLNVYL